MLANDGSRIHTPRGGGDQEDRGARARLMSMSTKPPSYSEAALASSRLLPHRNPSSCHHGRNTQANTQARTSASNDQLQPKIHPGSKRSGDKRTQSELGRVLCVDLASAPAQRP